MLIRRILTTFLAAAVLAASSASASEIWLTLDDPRRETFDRAIGSIVVGNPAIADVSVQSNTEVLLFGKTPGLTTITYIGTDGKPFRRMTVRVRTPSDRMVTLHAGGTRMTFSCTDVCEQTPMVGDGSNNSRLAATTVESQAQARVSAASSMTGGPASQSRSRTSGEQTLQTGPDGEPLGPEG